MENNTNVEKKDNKSLTRKIFTIVGNCVFYIFVIFLLGFAIANISSKKENGFVPNIFGTGMLNVVSNSMEGKEKKESLYVDDLIFVKLANEKRLSKLVVGESILTFYQEETGVHITHRLVDILKYEGVVTHYILQGDRIAVDYPDKVYVRGSNDFSNCEVVLAKNIVAIYTGTKIGGGGKLLNFLQSSLGFGLCIVLPTALLLLFQGYILIKNIFVLNKHKLAKELELKVAQTKADFDPEEEKRKIREQLLKEMEEENKKTEE